MAMFKRSEGLRLLGTSPRDEAEWKSARDSAKGTCLEGLCDVANWCDRRFEDIVLRHADACYARNKRGVPVPVVFKHELRPKFERLCARATGLCDPGGFIDLFLYVCRNGPADTKPYQLNELTGADKALMVEFIGDLSDKIEHDNSHSRDKHDRELLVRVYEKRVDAAKLWMGGDISIGALRRRFSRALEEVNHLTQARKELSQCPPKTAFTTSKPKPFTNSVSAC